MWISVDFWMWRKDGSVQQGPQRRCTRCCDGHFRSLAGLGMMRCTWFSTVRLLRTSGWMRSWMRCKAPMDQSRIFLLITVAPLLCRPYGPRPDRRAAPASRSHGATRHRPLYPGSKPQVRASGCGCVRVRGCSGASVWGGSQAGVGGFPGGMCVRGAQTGVASPDFS